MNIDTINTLYNTILIVLIIIGFLGLASCYIKKNHINKIEKVFNIQILIEHKILLALFTIVISFFGVVSVFLLGTFLYN